MKPKRPKEPEPLPVVSRSEYREILLARMAGGDLHAMEDLQKIRRADRLLDKLRPKPIYS